jgi:hypothetical protein
MLHQHEHDIVFGVLNWTYYIIFAICVVFGCMKRESHLNKEMLQLHFFVLDLV